MLVSHTKDITAAQKKMNTTVRPGADTYVHTCISSIHVHCHIIHEYMHVHVSVGDRTGPEES